MFGLLIFSVHSDTEFTLRTVYYRLWTVYEILQGVVIKDSAILVIKSYRDAL